MELVDAYKQLHIFRGSRNATILKGQYVDDINLHLNVTDNYAFTWNNTEVRRVHKTDLSAQFRG
jgi:hypothetical protein